MQADGLLTESVTSHTEFMAAITSVAASYKDYSLHVTSWKKGQSFTKKGSKIGTLVITADKQLGILTTDLSDLAHIEVVTTTLTAQVKSAQEKLNKMLLLLPVMFSVKDALEKAIPKLQGGIRAQKQRKFDKLSGTGQFMFVGGRSMELSWEKCLGILAEVECSGRTESAFTPLSADQLKTFPDVVKMCHRQGMCGIPSKIVFDHYKLALGNNVLRDIMYQLVDVFPLMCVERSSQYVLVDVTELVFRPGFVHDLLSLDSPAADDSKVDSKQHEPGCFFYQKTGPVSLQQRYPQIIEEIVRFVKIHGFAAHARRRTATATSCGVTIENIRRHLLENVEGLTQISRTKVYYLLQPARSNTIDAVRHKDAVDVRVGTKTCDISKENTKAHEYFATVSNVREMCAKYPLETTLFSCDSKAKIHIGGQAVSRYHQVRNFFPADDMPHYGDHDFPIPNYLIEPDGYLLLQSKSQMPVTIKDKLGRSVTEVPATGPMWIFNRCVKNTSTHCASHINDIRKILRTNPELKRPVFAAITDGGPDWTPKSNINQFFLGRLWRDESFEMVVCVCEPAGLSRFNPIEHMWSWWSRQLAGVRLSTCLPGENIPLINQHLPAAEKAEKEAEVLRNALDEVNTYLNDKTYDNFRVCSVPVYTDDDGTYQDYTSVKRMLNASLKIIREDKALGDLLCEWIFFMRHMDRRHGMVVLKRGACGDNTCVCQKDTIRAMQVRYKVN